MEFYFQDERMETWKYSARQECSSQKEFELDPLRTNY